MTSLEELNPDRALVFRITHRDNLPWILANGLTCRSSNNLDPNFVQIGLSDLIERRNSQAVPHDPGGRLSDYIPFYFTPLSMMAYRIKTGRNVKQRYNSEIVIIVTSLKRLEKDGVRFLFTDRHASVVGARYSSSLMHLDRIDWAILQGRDFSRDNDDLGKTNRYQAEALVHNYLPIKSVDFLACYDNDMKEEIERMVKQQEVDLKVIQRRGWYF